MPGDRIALGEEAGIVVVRVFLSLHVDIGLKSIEQLDGGGVGVQVNRIDTFQRRQRRRARSSGMSGRSTPLFTCVSGAH
jgi:hypothetical protein